MLAGLTVLLARADEKCRAQEIVLHPVKPAASQRPPATNKSKDRTGNKRANRKRPLAGSDSGATLAGEGKYSEAVKVYQAALRVRPNDAALHNNLGFAYANLGQHKESVEEYKKAIELDPTLVDAYYNLGQAYRRLNQNEEMVDAYQKGFKYPESLKREWAWTAALELGEVSGQLNHWDNAVKAYQLAVILKPKDAFAHYFLGEALAKTNKSQQAQEQYKILKNLDADLANRLLLLLPK